LKWFSPPQLRILRGITARTPEQKAAFASFFERVDPIRNLRNHIAHGHMLVKKNLDGKSFDLTLSQPKDLNSNYAPGTRHLSFQDLIKATTELGKLIQEFQTLTGFGNEE
jgi:hypothetical protein